MSSGNKGGQSAVSKPDVPQGEFVVDGDQAPLGALQPSASAEPKTPEPSTDWLALASQIVRREAFWQGLLIAAALGLVFQTLFKFSWGLWVSDDGYYSHAFLVPFLSGSLVLRSWPKLSERPVKAGWVALVPLLAVLWITRVAHANQIYAMLSICFLAALLCGTWLVAGWKWAVGLAAPILYLVFALPVWSWLIENYTNPLQRLSTEVAYQLIKLLGFDAYKDGPMNIILNTYKMEVAVACSGLKLVLALSAFAVYFVMRSGLKFWANVALLLLILPLAVFINGLRIALIGIVGEMNGADAAAKFHDYSGYITLILCFVILFKTARLLGWKD